MKKKNDELIPFEKSKRVIYLEKRGRRPHKHNAKKIILWAALILVLLVAILMCILPEHFFREIYFAIRNGWI